MTKKKPKVTVVKTILNKKGKKQGQVVRVNPPKK